MKKMFIMFLILLCFTAFSETEVIVSGSSEIQYGINLQESASGFLNPILASSLQFSLINQEDVEKGEVGYIKLSALNLTYDNDWIVGVPEVEAKILLNPLWVLISSVPDMKVNYTNPLEDDDDDDDTVDEGVTGELGQSGGITLGHTGEGYGIEIGIVSENDWTESEPDEVWGWEDDDDDESTHPIWGNISDDDDDDLNNENAYGVSGRITIDTDVIDIDAKVIAGVNYVGDEPIMAGGKVSVAVAPISAYIAGDIKSFVDTVTCELGGGISVSIIEGLSLTSDITYGELDNCDVTIGITEAVGGGLIPELNTTVAVTLNNVDVSTTWDVNATTAVIIDTVKSYISAGYGFDEILNVGGGLELSMMDNMLIVIDYTTDDVTLNNGTILLKAIISY